MADTKPSTAWGAASLVCSALGCLGALVWLTSVARPPVETTGVSAGLALLYVGFPSFTLSSLGIIFGVVAVGRIRSGGCRVGRRWAGWGSSSDGCRSRCFSPGLSLGYGDCQGSLSGAGDCSPRLRA